VQSADANAELSFGKVGSQSACRRVLGRCTLSDV
jgi:hypothetical protein